MKHLAGVATPVLSTDPVAVHMVLYQPASRGQTNAGANKGGRFAVSLTLIDVAQNTLIQFFAASAAYADAPSAAPELQGPG